MVVNVGKSILEGMFHQGYALKCFIAEGYVSANEIANDLGISKAAVYGLFGAEKLDKKYVDKLLKKKYEIVGVTTSQDESNIENANSSGGKSAQNVADAALRDKYIARLEEEVQLLKEYNDLLKKQGK